MSYFIGEIEGVKIIAETDSMRTAAVCRALFQAAAMGMRWRDAKTEPPSNEDDVYCEMTDRTVVRGCFYPSLQQWRVNREDGYYFSVPYSDNPVVRWMPLPEPYPTTEEMNAAIEKAK